MKFIIYLLMLAITGVVPGSDSIENKAEVNQTAAAGKPFTILTGRLIKQEYIPDVQKRGCQRPGTLCTNVYYAFTIAIEEVISGEPLSGEVMAVRYQHGSYLFRSSQLAIFVLSQIEDQQSVKLLGSPYFVEEYSRVHASYCLSEELKSYNPYVEEGEECFELIAPQVDARQITGNIRWKILSRVLENTELYLDEKDLLKGYISEYSDGERVITWEEHEAKYGACDHADVDLQEQNKACDDSQYLRYNSYQVNKGHAEEAMKYFKQELHSSGLLFKPTDFRYQIVEHDEYSEFQIHTKY